MFAPHRRLSQAYCVLHRLRLPRHPPWALGIFSSTWLFFAPRTFGVWSPLAYIFLFGVYDWRGRKHLGCLPSSCDKGKSPALLFVLRSMSLTFLLLIVLYHMGCQGSSTAFAAFLFGKCLLAWIAVETG